MGSLVNSSYELIDPCPDIFALFAEFDGRFFDGLLAGCELKWSTRMTTCAGLCAYEGRGGLCSIRLSEPLLKLRPRSDLIETLLHEMIHAYLFVTVRFRDHEAHGENFQYHMRRINAEAGTSITIYHSFHAEVAIYKQHHWRCEGPCRDRRPFYGWVKRATNRAPGPNDLWWQSHQQRCGGKFTKVREPEGYQAKGAKRKKKIEEENGEATTATKGDKAGNKKQMKTTEKKTGGAGGDPKQTKIERFFGGTLGGDGESQGSSSAASSSTAFVGSGQRLGGASSGTSRLLQLTGVNREWTSGRSLLVNQEWTGGRSLLSQQKKSAAAASTTKDVEVITLN